MSRRRARSLASRHSLAVVGLVTVIACLLVPRARAAEAKPVAKKPEPVTLDAKSFEKLFKGRVFRFVDVHDIVPKLPTISITSNLYKHCPQEMPLGTGKPATLAAELAPGAEIPPEAVPGVWQSVMGQLESHFMNNYMAKIDERCG